MRRELFHFRTIIFFTFLFSIFQAKADKEASLFQLDLSDTITASTIRQLPVIVFDSMRAIDLVPFTLPYEITYWKAMPTRKKTSLETAYDSMMIHDKLTRRSVYNIAVSRPDLIDFYGLQQFDETLNSIKGGRKEFHVEGVEEPELIPMPFTLEQPKKSKENAPWSFKGNLSLQFSQYYVTDNWEKGGTPNATFLSILEYSIHYEKNRWLWENDIEAEIGFYNTDIDTVHAIRVNSDEIRVPTRLGYQTSMSKKLYYSTHIVLKTPLLKSYTKTNSKEVSASFLSPSKLYFGIIGLDYKHNKHTRLSIYPWSYKLIFVLPNSEVDHLKSGFDSTQCHRWFSGYIIQTSLNWRLSKEIQITSSFDLFNSYNFKHIDLDWKTIGKFNINRFLSTRLSLQMIFDNARIDKKSKIQIKEQLSFGFSYNFH